MLFKITSCSYNKEFEITKVVVVVAVIDSTFCSSYPTCTCKIKDGGKTT